MPARALLRIWRRINYKHLTNSKINGIPFNTKLVKEEITRTFMKNILAYQQYRRDFYYDKRHSSTPYHRGKKEVESMKSLGELDYSTGKLEMNDAVKQVFIKFKVWRDFNQLSTFDHHPS